VPQVGFVTIGQSPRDDILHSMLPLRLHTSVLQQGALDRLTRHEIEDLHPESEEVPYVTRLSDGSEVLVSKKRLMPQLQNAVNAVVEAGADVVVILCTGEFPETSADVPVIYPDRILKANIDALLPAGVIGVLMPHKDQMENMRSKWQTVARRITGIAVSPYCASNELASAGRKLENEGADMIVMDCMGFTRSMKAVVAGDTSRPIILANRLVGRVIEELMTVEITEIES
jgi:protein AroM